MKILQINTVYKIGSTGRIVSDLASTILKSNSVCKVIARNETPSTIGLKTSKLSLYIDVLQSRILGKHSLNPLADTSRVLEFIKDYNPDLIHLHNVHGYYLNIEQIFHFLSEYRKPVVWTLHDCWAMTGHCAHFSAVACDKWKTGCFSCPQLSTYPKSLFLDRSRFQYSLKSKLFNSIQDLTIVPVSDWLGSIVANSFLKEKPRVVINNGVNLDVFRYTDVKFVDTDKVILLSVASQWTKRKGFDDLLKLSAELNNDEVLVIVGLSTKQIQSLPPNIIGIERTNNIEELVALYSQATVLLSLSVEETFGMTIIEGFACGTPAIVYNSTATLELINSDVGAIVEPHDLAGLRKAIDQIRSSNVDYKKNCIDLVRKYYDKEDRYQDYIDLYKRLIENNK